MLFKTQHENQIMKIIIHSKVKVSNKVNENENAEFLKTKKKVIEKKFDRILPNQNIILCLTRL